MWRRAVPWLSALVACTPPAAPRSDAPTPAHAEPTSEPEDAAPPPAPSTTSGPGDAADASAAVPAGDTAPDPASAQPAWLSDPFGNLPAALPGRDLVVEIRVVSSAPTKLHFPELGRETELFEAMDGVLHCTEHKSPGNAALTLSCLGNDGAFVLRVYQDGRELVLDAYSIGDAPPPFRAPHRIVLPNARRARFVSKLPGNRSHGSSGP